MATDNLNEYFEGRKLYGDDFTPEQIKSWYDDEREGYAGLGAQDHSKYVYVYHALNRVHAFDRLPARRFDAVLGIGSAYGNEFLPIAHRIGRLTIIESSQAMRRSAVPGVLTTYAEPNPTGVLPFDNECFDLITCFGVLHHIPNVSFVVREMYRCLRPGGFALIREPIVSMGDWRLPRPGLTKRERGIPREIFRGIIRQAGFRTLHERLCMFPVVQRLFKYVGNGQTYNSRLVVRIDHLLCKVFAWNRRYHAHSSFQKLRPASLFFVLTK